jgi:hypothetical protein
MKTTWLFFLAICAVPMFGRSYAAASNALPQPTSLANSANKTSKPISKVQHTTSHVPKPPQIRPGKQRNYRSSDASYVVNHGSVASANRSKQLPDNQRRLAGSPSYPNQSGPARSRAVANKGLLENKPSSSALLVRPPALLLASSPSLGTVRHRGANPAVIGGGNSSANNTGALNGTRMTRRP